MRRAELVAGRGAQAIQVVLERLAEARLVTLADDSVEVAHEALIGSVLTGGKFRRVACFGQMSCPEVAQWPSGLQEGDGGPRLDRSGSADSLPAGKAGKDRCECESPRRKGGGVAHISLKTELFAPGVGPEV